MNVHSMVRFVGNRFRDIQTWLLLGFNIVLVPAMFHWISGSRQWRGGTFFNVRVEPGFVDSDGGQAILQRFRRRIWSWAALLLIVLFLSSLRWDLARNFLWFVIIQYATMIGCWRMFSLASRQTRQQATPAAGPSVRAAELFIEEEKVDWWVATLEWLGMLLPLAVPATAVVILTFHWRQLPPDETLSSVKGILSAVFVGMIPAGTQFALRFHARSSDWNSDPRASRRYRAVLGAVHALIFTFIIMQGCALAIMPLGLTRGMDEYFRLTEPGWLIVIALTVGIRWWLKRNLARESGDPMPDKCWKWGFYYVNPDDPAFVVPSRMGTGLSLNYGQRVVWVTWVTIAAAILIDLAWSFGMLSSSAR
jgi:hypothetical protein